MRLLPLTLLTLLLGATAAKADTLPEALASAYATNPTLAAARSQARQADEGWAQARSGFLPQISATGSLSERETETETTIGGLTTRTTQEGEPGATSVVAQQSIFQGGRRIAQIGFANAQIGIAQESLRATEQGLLLQVITAFVDVRRAEEQLRIRTSNVALLEQQLQAARDRFEVGEITRTDVAQSEARLAGAVAGLASAQSDLQGVRAQYRRIVGVEAGSLEPPPPAPGLPAGLDEAVSIALDANPDVRRLLQAEKAAAQQVRIERSSLLPSVGIVSRIDRGYDNPSRGVDSDTTTTSAQVTIPLFEGGLANSRTRAARIGVERARQQTEETRRAVVAQVTRAWNDHLAAQRVIESTRTQLRANELAFEGVQEEQKVGLRTTLDVLNAQQELLNAQLAVVSAERDAYVAAHAVLSSMGRLDAEALSVNSPLYDPDEHRERVRRTILSTFPAGVR